MGSKRFVGSLGLTCALSVAAALPVAAQSPPESPTEAAQPQLVTPVAAYAVIDTRRVVAESEIGRGITARGEMVAASWEERVLAGRQGLVALSQRREQQALTLNESALAVLTDEIEERSVAQQRLEEDAERELASLSQELMLEMNRVLGPSLERFAQERGFLFIFDSSAAAENGLLYWASGVDVTGEFIAQLDGAVAQWRGVRDDTGPMLGSARAP